MPAIGAHLYALGIEPGNPPAGWSTKASKAMLSSLQREPHWLEVAQNTHWTKFFLRVCRDPFFEHQSQINPINFVCLVFFAKLFIFCHFCYSSKVPRVCLSHDCCLLVAIHKRAPAGSAGLTWDWRVWHHPVHPQWKYLSYEKTGRYMETIWNACNCIRKHWAGGLGIL